MAENETTKATPRHDLRSEIKSALNRASAENASGTPDHVLADYLLGCLDGFDAATRARDAWWGHEPRIVGLISAVAAPVPHPAATDPSDRGASNAPDALRVRVEALAAEAAWLATAHANSADKGYSSEYRAGFAAAAGWVNLHAEMAAQAAQAGGV